MIEKLRAIRATLDKVEVHGLANMDKLMGCIQVLDAMIRELEEEMKHDACDAE